jgi:hypothetical protein
MTTLDQKRMLKLAGLLKEGVEEWIDETAPDMEKVPHANVDADLNIPMGYAPGKDQSGDDEERERAKERFKNSLLTHAGQDLKLKDLPVEEPVASAEEEEFERLPKQMSMRKSGNRPRFPSLEETYIDGLNSGGGVSESLEEAPPPHDPEERKAAGLNPLPKDEKGPFGEELPRGNKFGAQTLKANPGLVELHETIRSLVREVLLEKAKSYKGKSMRLGGGGRFAKFVDSLKKSGKSEEQARAIAYKSGVKKYGKEKMKKMATAGKKREAKKEA